MGTRMAPSYANIFIASLGQQMLLHSPHNLLPFIWLRFIDDIFMLWTHGSTVLTIFLQHINSFNHTIKLSHQQSHTPINFLDITIPLTKQGTLQSTLYIKPTDKGLLLHHASQHPTACKKGTIYSQALRYQRISTDEHDLRQHLQRLHKILLVRGYSHSPITAAFIQQSHLAHTENQLLRHKPTPATTGVHIQFVVPYKTDLPPISHILRQHWHLTQNDPTRSQLFPRQPFLSLIHWTQNLKDMLVHSRFSTQKNTKVNTTINNPNTTTDP